MDDATVRRAYNKIAKVITDKVKAFFNSLDKSSSKSNYDGSVPYKHMADEVQKSVKVKNGVASIFVGGGKYTGYKWHILDSGTYDSKGRKHTPAMDFTTKVMKYSEAEIDKIVDDIIAEVTRGE